MIITVPYGNSWFPCYGETISLLDNDNRILIIMQINLAFKGYSCFNRKSVANLLSVVQQRIKFSHTDIFRISGFIAI